MAVTHSSGGLQFCECKTCGKKFVVQMDGVDLLDRYLTERAKIFTVIETAKLNGDKVEHAKQEMEVLLHSFAVLAEIDSVYYWYKIILLTDNFTDYTNLQDAEREYLNIPQGACYFVSSEDMVRRLRYEKQYAAYIEKHRKEMEKAAGKKKKKKKAAKIAVSISVAALVAGAGCFVGFYNPALVDAGTGIKVQTSVGGNGIIGKFRTKMDAVKLTEEDPDFVLTENTLTDDLSRFTSYRIRLLENGVETQPKKALTVTMPVPEGYFTKKLSVYALTPVELGGDDGAEDGNDEAKAVVAPFAENTEGEEQPVALQATELEYEYVESSNTLRFSTPYFGIVAVGEHPCLVSFVGDDIRISAQKAAYGTPTTEPATPTRTGYTFDKWYAGAREYDFAQAVQDDLTLTAKWIANKYTVRYYMGGDPTGETKEVTFGSLPELKQEATKTGYSVQWYYGSTLIRNNEPWKIADDVRLDGQEEPNRYPLTVKDVPSGCCPADSVGVVPEAIYDNKLPDLTELPRRTGYTFEGYYTESNGGGEKIYDNEGKPVSENIWQKTEGMTIYAKWTQKAGYDAYTRIATVDDLKNVRKDLAGKYLLVHDIDLGGENWTPFASFTGIFDGGGHKIYNFSIENGVTLEEEKDDIMYFGIFSLLRGGGIIRNLQVGNEGSEVRITFNKNHQRAYAGLIVGWSDSGTLIENCRAINGTISLESKTNTSSKHITTKWNNLAGGIVGKTWKSTVRGCYAVGCDISIKASTQWDKMSARAIAGGIVGYEESGTVEDCLAKNNKISTYAVCISGNVFNPTGDAYARAAGLIGEAEKTKILRSVAVGGEYTATKSGSGNVYRGALIGQTSDTSPSELVSVGMMSYSISGSNSSYGGTKIEKDSYEALISGVKSYATNQYFVADDDGKIAHNFYVMASK